jgi:hypothetical protein
MDALVVEMDNRTDAMVFRACTIRNVSLMGNCASKKLEFHGCFLPASQQALLAGRADVLLDNCFFVL